MMDFGLVSPFPAQMTRITFAVWGKPNKAGCSCPAQISDHPPLSEYNAIALHFPLNSQKNPKYPPNKFRPGKASSLILKGICTGSFSIIIQFVDSRV